MVQKFKQSNLLTTFIIIIQSLYITNSNQQKNDMHKLNVGLNDRAPMQIILIAMYSCKREYLSRIHILFICHMFILAPLEKLVTSDKLSFIPNLYYQQYRLLDILNQIRADYPEQKILVKRNPTRHDNLMEEMRRNHFLLEEELKYRKAMCYHLAKHAKQEFFKKKLKKEEKYLFHRVALSQLAEAVKIKFQQLKPILNQKKQQAQNNKKTSKPQQPDDIFMDKEDSNLILGDPDGDLLDGIFLPQRIEEPVEEPVVVKILKIEDYMQAQSDNDNKFKQCKKILNRKNCFKKINENIRKRIKSKLNEESGEKNLNSATVIITGLISSQTDPKQSDMQNQQQFIDTPAETQFLSNIQSKTKKKKQQNFQLKWSKESMNEFNDKNCKFEINKSKFDLNYLTTSILKDEKEYEKVFSKNINREHFPPSLNSIPQLKDQFKQNQYYNTSADRQYEQFIIKYNKKSQFFKFKQVSKFAVVENLYGNESEPTNISKMFLNPEKIDSNVSDRVIYKVNNNRLIPVNAVYQKTNLSKEELLILSFLVRRFLGIFGSNWKIITMLILTNPNFSNMFLNTQQIQQLYQIAKDKNNDTLIEQINMMNKKMLPASLFVNSSYEEMDENKRMQTIFEEEMTDESEQKVVKQLNTIELDDYQKLINEPLTEHIDPKQYVYHNTAKAYDTYIKNVTITDIPDYHSTLTENLGLVISQFEGKSEVKYVTESKQPAKFSQCSDWVLDKVKNQIKFNTPVRKRKNITDKSSQLVKILHTLKQKLQNPVRQPVPPASSRPAVTANGPVPDAARPAASTTPTPTPTPPPSQTQAPPSSMKKTLPKPKPEDKKQKAAPKQQKQRKKKGGKDGDKEGEQK